ncbi:type VI secretion system accessory protein TagJ [Aurantivibrio plasticivorans]
MSTAMELFNAGDLPGAIEAVNGEIRSQPNNVEARALLVELLCFSGDLERADKQLNTMLSLDPQTAFTVGTWRQLIRSAQTRNDVFEQGATPSVIDTPTKVISNALAILLAARTGESDNVQALIDENDTQSSQLEWVINEEEATLLRDADDVLGGITELLGSNGKYFWVDNAQIESLEFVEITRPLELLWRPVDIALSNGTHGQAFLPAIYHGSSDDADVGYSLGKKTDWVETNGVVRGKGLRQWLVNDELLSAYDFKEISNAKSEALVS